MEALGDLGDDAYRGERAVIGAILGQRHEDGSGTWTEAFGISMGAPGGG